MFRHPCGRDRVMGTVTHGGHHTGPGQGLQLPTPPKASARPWYTAFPNHSTMAQG